ncbi:hypothetical protein F4774DRAFT_406819 [Daldinia eschscholtzii]|nr:hypothetical protein F4774DRAFT_406819 [Daldinia eschscholtzii]
MTAARLGQFIPHGGLDQVLIGEPLRRNWDICNAVCEGETAEVRVFSEISVLDPGEPNGMHDRDYRPPPVAGLRGRGRDCQRYRAECKVLPAVMGRSMGREVQEENPWS